MQYMVTFLLHVDESWSDVKISFTKEQFLNHQFCKKKKFLIINKKIVLFVIEKASTKVNVPKISLLSKISLKLLKLRLHNMTCQKLIKNSNNER